MQDEAMFNAIEAALKDFFERNPGPVKMHGAREEIIASMAGTPFSFSDLHQEVYAHIRSACRNLKLRKAYKSVRRFLNYDLETRTYRVASIGEVLSSTPRIRDADSFEAGAESTRFALESHLRDYLAQNLFLIEAGLKLWTDDPKSVEYIVDERRIDILAKDSEGHPVVIELKLGKGHDRVIGQALLYRALLCKQLKVNKVRIVLVASEITQELKLAASQIGDVNLFTYAISMVLSPITAALDHA